MKDRNIKTCVQSDEADRRSLVRGLRRSVTEGLPDHLRVTLAPSRYTEVLTGVWQTSGGKPTAYMVDQRAQWRVSDELLQAARLTISGVTHYPV